MLKVNDQITWPTICVFGDSIVEGANDETGQGWADRLKASWKAPNPEVHSFPNVYNLGVDGDRTSDVLRRFEVETASRNARGIILSVGANDLPWKDGRTITPTAEFEHDYRRLLESALQYTTNVLVISLLAVDENAGDHGVTNRAVRELNNIIEGICGDLKVKLLNVSQLLVPAELDDGIHPNTAGYIKIYQTVQAKLVDLGWDRL